MLMRRRSKRGRCGAAMAEMAVVTPLFVTLVLGQIETARLGMVAQLLTTAAREGCRVAVLNGSTASTVQTRVNAFLSGSGINVGTVTPTPSNWATAAGGTAITVTLSVPYSSVSWFSPSHYLKDAKIQASATMSSERP